MLSFRRSRDARRLRGESGITLMELVVTMAIGTVIGAMATQFFVTAYHSGYGSVNTNQNTADARITLDSWTSNLRVADWFDPATLRSSNVADRFELITPTKIVFYASLGNRPAGVVGDPASVTKVALLLNPNPSDPTTGQLVQILFRADNVTPLSVRQLAFKAGQSTDPNTSQSKWLFTPYDKSGSALSTSATKCVNSSGGAVIGYCYSPPSGTGTYDPRLTPGTHNVVTGTLHGDGSANATLANVGRIDIAIRLMDSNKTHLNDFTSSVAVNSVFPS